MVKLSGLSKLFSRLSCVGLGVALIGVMYLSVDAKTVTIDADGTATYKSLDLFLSSINNAGESTIPDTVLFTGLNQHTYSCSTNFYIQSITKTILFIGGTSDPDKFPIINHTNYNSYGFFQSAPVKFERLIFTGSVSFDNGQGAKPLAFSKCVVRNYKSSFFDFAGNGAQNIMFDNCLFVNNTDTIFKLNFWTADTRVAFINCTFDRNKGIFGGNSVSGVTNFVLRNNIFINNASISKFTNIITKIQNSLTSEALTTGYDASNAQIFAADTTTLFLKTNRATDTLPSAWKIGSSSKAKNYGTFYTGVTTDIAGDLRAITKVDAGCWAVDNSVQFVVQPKPDTVVQEKTATFIAAVTNPEGVSYRWHRIGSTDTLGVKDTLSITATAALDSARIYCVASNAQATQSSDTVMLRVVTAPVIVGDAASRIIVPNGGSKTFAVTAKGLQLRYYWYIDNNKVTSDSSKPELTIASVTKDAYQNKTIYCEISNDFSTVKTLSDTIIVSDNLPVITTDLKDIATYAGSNARFKIVATHATPLKYIWFKTSPAGEKTIIAGASSADSLILTNIALADSNSKIECYVVSVVEDTAKSRAAALIVKSVPKPKITAQSGASIETREGTSLSLFIEHTAIEGVTDTIKWYHVGTLVKNETLKTLTIANVTKANEGVYFCVLSNSGGSVKSAEIKVTIRGESDVYNPIQLSGQLIDRGNVRVTIRNFSNLPSSPDNDRYVDTIGVWWMTNTSVPGKPNMSSTRLMKYSLAELVSSSGGADTVTVTIPVALGDDACDTLLFLSTPFWRKPDSLPPFNTGIGAKVYSCGAKNLVNTLTITKVNQIKDTVVIKVSGFGSLQKSDASYAVIYYGEKTEKSSYTLKNDKFPAESDNLTFVNSDFQTVENSVNWSVYLRSTNGSYSDTVTKPIKIGFSPPPNDATLIIDSTNAYNAYLSWSLSTPADSIAIVFSKSKIEVGTVITDTAAFKKIIVNGFETNSMIDGLKASTVYYFALLKKKNGIWSTLAVDAIKSMATKVPDYTTIPNIIKITSSWFDSTRNIFKIKFIFDTTGLGKSSFKLAYTYSDKGYIRDSSYSIDAIVPKDQKRIETFALNLNDTSFIEFDFGNTLRFETKYYFALFIKPQNSDKYLSATDSSVTTISSGQMNWATVSMYATIPEVRVFENNVVIRQGEDWLVEKSARINDTLKYIRNVKKLNGFINVSSGVKFVKGNDVPAVYLGMKPDSIPEGFSIKDVRLYLCDTTFSGVYVVPGVQTQSSDSLVSALINTRKPSRYQDSIFVLLIDTIKPLVTQLDNFKTDVVSDMVNVSFKFDIKDNVSDIYVKFVASAWRDAGIVVMNQFVRDTVIDFDLPTGFVDQKSGLCASLIVSDGRFTDTINLSKTVATKLTIITIKEQWDPISVRYNLNNVKINHLVSLLNKDNKYDKTQFRIFKWEENPDKNPNPRKDKYLELDQVKNGDSTLFDLKPGNLLWLKTRESQTIVLDSLAKTMPMNDPVVVKIPRNQYVDFGMPFEYTVKLGDIARASQLIENGSNKNGLLSIYRWEKQGGIYKTELKYSDVANGDLLEGLSEDGSYTATFETPGTEEFLDLKIPAVPIARSTFLGVEIPKVSKQYVDKSNWNFKISSSDNNCVFTSIYAGFNPKFKAMGKIQIALPPTMSDIKVGFLDNSVMYGQSFAAKDEEGYAYTIRFVNNGNEAKIINCQLTENIPSGKFFKLFNSVTGELTDVSNGFSIPVAAGSSSDQILLAGSDQYIRKFASLNAGVEFALLQMYPNPFKGALTIKFTLPLTGVNLVTCRLFDALGRTVWNFNIDKDLKPGLNTFNWQPGTHSLKKLASGTYILKLTAEDVSGHKKGSGVSRLMYLAD